MRMQHTNEELVKLIQEGHEDQIEQLWLQVEKFVVMKAKMRLRGNVPEHIGNLYFEDLCQSGYFALLDAIKQYNPDKDASFLTYLTFHLMRHFNETLNLRTSKGKREAQTKIESWDAPFGDSDLTLKDIIADPRGEDGYTEIIERAFNDDMNYYVLKAINSLPDEEYKKYFVTFIGCDCSRTLTRKKLCWEISKARKIYDKGILQLRRFMLAKKKELESIGIDEIIEMQSYKSGISRFINNRFTSSTEDAVFRLLELKSAEAEIYSFKTRIMEDEEEKD